MNQSSPLVEVAMVASLAALACGCGLSGPGHRFNLPRRGNKYAVGTAGRNAEPSRLTTRVAGNHRNAPCYCGSGVKAKRCQHDAMLARIVKHDHPALSAVAEPFTEQDLSDDRLRVMELACRCSSNGVGLAANQIDWLKRAIYLWPDRKQWAEGDGFFMFNPEIVAVGDDREEYDEGCLSYPGVFARVRRSAHITVAWRDRQWNSHCQSFHGFNARVIGHEIDHLNGVCFVGNQWRDDRDREPSSEAAPQTPCT